MAKAIMIQGAGSNVGKSLIVAGLARAFVKRGLKVAPFKPQNMSNNAAVAEDGGEIGRAQALQARAAGLEPHTDMNPVLLKPESETGAQIIVQGQRWGTLKARDYGKRKHELLPAVLQSFHRLAASVDLVIVEGAGSPAEVNLRAGDIANMGFAEAANVPIILVGDIDRGGVIAQLVGTQIVLPEDDRSRIKAFIINKFRGDPTLFDAGLTAIKNHTDWPSLGVLPWFPEAWRLPAEDVIDITSYGIGTLKIAVPRLKRIANFDDLDPLKAEPDVELVIVEPGRPLPGDAALVIIPGSKSTITDLADFRIQGWDIDLAAHIRRGGHVLGLCGGYQMLGTLISDPLGIEGAPSTVPGLGHLNIQTTMQTQKQLSRTTARHLASGHGVDGYEIHIGESHGPDANRPFLQIADRPEGAVSRDGRIMGTYLHGIFSSDDFRQAFLTGLGAMPANGSFDEQLEVTLDQLASHMEKHLDLDAILELAKKVDCD
jgi:adenosylcobyric acid synthase